MILRWASSPWFWISMKNRSGPKMSRRVAALLSARSKSRSPATPSSRPASGARWKATGPERHPEVAMIPSACSASSSKSILGL